MGRIDDNHDYVAMAAEDNIGLLPVPLLVDPVTGRLLIVIYPTTDTVPVLNTTKVDENHEPSSKAVTDNVATDIRTLLIDSQNGFLWCDVFIEP